MSSDRYDELARQDERDLRDWEFDAELERDPVVIGLGHAGERAGDIMAGGTLAGVGAILALSQVFTIHTAPIVFLAGVVLLIAGLAIVVERTDG